MRVNFKEPELDMRASLGFVRNITDPLIAVREPLGEYRTMLDLIRRDPVIATAFDIVVDFSTFRGYDFIQGSKEQRDKARTKFDDLNWHPIDRNLKYSSLTYGDAFLELRDIENSGRIDELHPLETTEMRIAFDTHGEIPEKGAYVQRPFNMSGMSKDTILDRETSQGKWFDKDQVIHYRTKWIGSEVYSHTPLESASTAISTKLFATNYLMNIFINMPPRYHLHLAGASEKMRKDLRSQWQAGKTNYRRNALFSSSTDPNSKADIKKIDPIYDKELMDVIKFLRHQILALIRVPRSWVEESAMENRGVTEAEQRPFDVKILSFQKDPYEVQNNKILLPALGFKTKGTGADKILKFKYNTISWKNELEILQNAGLLRDMGLKPKALVSYLDNRGILGLDPSDFEEQQLQKNVELNPSRKREDKATGDMTSKLDSQGVSKAGEKKSKEVAMRSGTDFTKYPYNMS